MNKIFYAATAAVLSFILAAPAAQAEDHQDKQGQGTQQPAEQDPQAIANRKAEEALELSNRKEEMLLRITHQIEEMQKKKSCIQAASTREDLQKCMPAMGGPGGMGMGMGGKGMGGQQHDMKMGMPPGQQPGNGTPGDGPAERR